MNTTRLWTLALAGGVIAGTGCVTGGPRPAEDDPSPPPAAAAIAPERAPVPRFQSCDLQPIEPPPDPQCQRVQCGGNSSYVTGFDLGALSLDGCRNHRLVRLLPDSLRAGDPRCPTTPLSIDLVGGAIVGLSGGAPACSGDALVGATFWIEGLPWTLGDALPRRHRMQRVRQELRIRAVGTAPVPEGGGPALPSYAIEKTGAVLAIDDPTSTDPAAWYELSRRAGPDTDPGGLPTALCAHADQWITSWVPAPPASSVDQHMLVLAGELYTRHAELDGAAAEPRRWFHLACAGSALAKARLMGLDPATGTSTADERVAALKMLTARYCGSDSFTVPGMPIFFESRTGPGRASLDPVEADRVGPIEARWTARGASCISHARVWRRGPLAPPDLPIDDCCTTEAELVAAIRARCGIPACSATSTAADEHWTSYTVDHFQHPQTLTTPIAPVPR